MDREKWRFRLYAGAALAAGLLLRLWFVLHLARFAGDSLIYGAIARNWIQHGVYGFGQTTLAGAIVVRPTLIRLPGYPLFLVVCFRLFGMENYRAVIGMQVTADLATCWLVSALSGRLFGRHAALVVLWLAALCPFTANYVATPLTETLVLTTIALTFYGLARWQDAGAGFNRWLWIVAAALAWSVLLRPEQGLLAAAVLPAMLWASLRKYGAFVSALPVLAAALCVALPLLPWTIRNWRTFHVLQPLAPRYANDPGEFAPIGFGRWYRTWAIEFASTDEVYWNYNGDQIRLADLPARVFNTSSPAQREDLYARTAALLADYNTTTAATPAIDARFAALAAERVRAHPILYYLVLPFARVLNMALRPRVEMMPVPDEWWKPPTPIRVTAFAASYAALNLAYLILGFAGFYAWWRCAWSSPSPPGIPPCCFRELVFATAVSFILRFALLLTIDNSEPRYTLEFFPVLFVWAGALFASPLPPTPTQEHGRG